MGDIHHGRFKMKNIKIEHLSIGENFPVFIIAEIGINHGGDLSIAKELVSEAKKSGASAVKFQTYITEKRVDKSSSIFTILKKCELSHASQSEIFEFSRDIGIIPFSTPFDDESVDFLESLNCPAYKIASFDTVNCKLLKKVASTKKPIIMSLGMTNLKELGLAWKALGGSEDGTGCDLALLHCISSYPTPKEEANLSVIPYLKKIHNGPVGYSDHTIGHEVPVLSVVAGARIIEKHFTLDSNQKGPDHALSADPKTFLEMVSQIRHIEKIMGNSDLLVRDIEKKSLQFRRISK
jgi:N,N'-diacetyllegionaminate synthase